jgi:hypothetical protein
MAHSGLHITTRFRTWHGIAAIAQCLRRFSIGHLGAPNPARYFQVIQGGPCTLVAMRRKEVTAECVAPVAPALLLRRELYMLGWGGRVEQNGIFQSAVLPVGRSEVRYHFAPP